jgi:SNF2 family DNA or RNA helicase
MNDFYVKNFAKRLYATYKTLQRLGTHPKALKLAEDTRKNRPNNKSNESDGSIADSDDGEETPVSDDDDRSEDQREDQLCVTPMSRTWFKKFVKDEAIIKMEDSGKLTILMEILRLCKIIDDKVVVFCTCPASLKLIDEFLEASGTWVPNKHYFRLDGCVTPQERKAVRDCFNDPTNQARLVLLSSIAGGLGDNLVTANRVVIFNASWNKDDFHCIQSVYW